VLFSGFVVAFLKNRQRWRTKFQRKEAFEV